MLPCARAAAEIGGQLSAVLASAISLQWPVGEWNQAASISQQIRADIEHARAELPSLLVPSLSSDQKAAAIAFISPLLAVNMHLDRSESLLNEVTGLGGLFRHQIQTALAFQ